MSPPSIQSRWKIDETRWKSMWDEIRKEKVQPDNVHAVARVACEQFGSTLAICDDTLNKVKTAVSETPQPVTVRFLGVTVVRQLNDSAAKLVESIEGQRFLGLAAAATTLFSLYDGAKALQAMLESTTSDTTTCPLAPELKTLLGSLQGRLYHAGFSESVMKWQIKLQRDIIAAEGHPDGSMSLFSQSAPSPEMVTKLVNVFRQLSEDDSVITGVTIKASEAAAWVVAFIEWCLGSPPSIYIGGSQQPLSQLGSVITLIIAKTPHDQRKGLEITIYETLNHYYQLTAPPSTKPFSGMATIGNYGKWLLERFGFRSASLDFLHEALNHAIPQTLETFQWAEFDFSEQEEHRAILTLTSTHDSYALYPLPDIHKIADVYFKLFGLAKTPKWAKTCDGILIADLPLVSQHLNSLRKNCLCSRCGRAKGRKTICKEAEFYELVSFITVEITVLSLFRSPDLLRIKLSREHESGGSLQQAVSRLIKTGDITLESTETMDLLQWARSMVGHKVATGDKGRSTIVSSGHGQVIYPSLFEALNIEKHGYLGLTSHQGILIYEGASYETVTADNGDSTQDARCELLQLSSSCPSQVSPVPLNAFNDLKVFWKVETQDNRKLSIALSVQSRAGHQSFVRMNPMLSFSTLQKSLLIEGCRGHGQCNTQPSSLFCSYSSPMDNHKKACDSTSAIDFVPVSDSNDLRFVSLVCTRESVILRKDACLACCLNLCYEVGYHVLIL
ncbi:uncharacterized protein FMAN_14104 [Fusarium mangiferae]|uniref:Uncharacterized protein n=1 Tax=Fusarium mangiferae TaxID=192010 RepID=A0A1L7UM48_FUSMA|nr:uncharacterized protein FMAN_14104 [Fusarium mangiferae]CVL08867.1 uncharacterized protein FMAN_14104 [Fusarium mangiferae]